MEASRFAESVEQYLACGWGLPTPGIPSIANRCGTRMSDHADSDASLKSPRIWRAEDFRALDTVRVGKSEVVYAFVSLGGKPSVVDEVLLDDMERGRARRFIRRTDRHRFILAHAALRLFLAGCLGAGPAMVRYEGGVSGKPRLAAGLAPLEFNLSHSEELALMAVARQRAVGVDVERLRDVPEALGIADVYFSRQEREELHSLQRSERREAFFRCWTRKEAVTKASGEGLGTPIDSFEVDLTAASTSALNRDTGRREEEVRWCVRDLQSPRGYAAAGAVEAADSARVGWRELSD
jgi:4'-phosphopantetheinyl transferase